MRTTQIGIIKKPSAWLHEKPGETAVTDELLMGWAVGILAQEQDWLWVVTHYGYKGYLRSQDVVMHPLQLCSRDKTKQMVVDRAFVDVMECPGVRGRILTTLSKGSFVVGMTEYDHGYGKIILPDGRGGYIPAAACRDRTDGDGFLYDPEPETWFLRQKKPKTEGTGTLGENLVREAKSYLGVQYRWGGKSSAGIDCSGLVFMSCLLCGILIYRDAERKDGYPVKQISTEELSPGDLLYFPGHVAMYMGDGRYIHATGHEKSFCCRINSLREEDSDYLKDLAERLLAAGRVIA